MDETRWIRRRVTGKTGETRDVNVCDRIDVRRSASEVGALLDGSLHRVVIDGETITLGQPILLRDGGEQPARWALYLPPSISHRAEEELARFALVRASDPHHPVPEGIAIEPIIGPFALREWLGDAVPVASDEALGSRIDEPAELSMPPGREDGVEHVPPAMVGEGGQDDPDRVLHPTVKLNALDRHRGHVELTDDVVTVHFAIPAADRERLEPSRLECIVQLHFTPVYPIVNLLFRDPELGEDSEIELFAIFDAFDDDDRAWLERLAERFLIAAVFHFTDDYPAARHRYRPSFEENVRHILERVDAWHDEHEPEDDDFDRAAAYFASERFERGSGERPNFGDDALFSTETADAVRLALRRLAYWSEEQNRQELIERAGVPLGELEAAQDRVIDAALRFGLALSPDLRDRAISDARAANPEALVERLLGAFAEHAEDDALDTFARWENWKALLDEADRLDVDVPPDLRARAQRAYATAREHAVHSGEHVAVYEFDDSDVEELSVGEDTGITLIGSLDDLDNQELRELLKNRSLLADAAAVLARRGGETNVFHVIEAAPGMDVDDVERIGDLLAEEAEAIEPALLMGLGRDHDLTVYLCALALARGRRPDALPSLFDMLHADPPRLGVPVLELLLEYEDLLLPALDTALDEHGESEPMRELARLLVREERFDPADADDAEVAPHFATLAESAVDT